MADVDYSHDMGAHGRGVSEQESEESLAKSLTTWTNFAGAVVSLALIGGVGVWGYELMVRDVSGIPIVRAAASEMRVRPEDPGGRLAEHQGLAVNEIAARGQASGPVDRVVLAPPAVALAAEDQPVIADRHAPVLQPAPLAPAASAFGIEVRATQLSDDTPAEAPAGQSEIDILVAALMAEADPVDDRGEAKVVQASVTAPSDATAPTAASFVTEAPEPKIIDAAGARLSLRPRLRPSDMRASVQKASFTATPQTREVDANAIPSGTRLAQLGAFESPDIARAEWGRMQSRFGDILEGKSRVVQEAQSGGRTFYRLRAMGFVDISDARRFCSAVKAEGVDCIPVQVK
jgi:hypothetical protein